jgi:hypothetical protein
MVCKTNQRVDRGGGSPMTRTPVADATLSACGHATSGCPGTVPSRSIPAGQDGSGGSAVPRGPAVSPRSAVAPGPVASRGPAVSSGLAVLGWLAVLGESAVLGGLTCLGGSIRLRGSIRLGGLTVSCRSTVLRRQAVGRGSLVSREPACARGVAHRPAIRSCRLGLVRPPLPRQRAWTPWPPVSAAACVPVHPFPCTRPSGMPQQSLAGHLIPEGTVNV